MRLSPYRVLGFRRTSAGRIALQVEFVLPQGENMTGLGELATAAADQLQAFAKQLAETPAKPAVAGDADDVTALNRLADVLAAMQKPTAPAATSGATIEPIPTT